MTEDQLRELFLEMRDEPVPPDSQARVRMAVAARTASPRSWWKAATLILAPACVVLVVLLHRQPPAPVQRPKIPVVVQKVESAPVPPPVVRVKHRIAKPPSSHVAEAAALIRIETPDPDVVILLVGG